MTCRCCGRELPLASFERFKTGTYRKVCWQCRWVINGRGVRKRSLLKQHFSERTGLTACLDNA